jgi:hypothetical protein
MDRNTIIIQRKSIHNFLSTISFNKSYYKMYNNILSRKIVIDNVVIIFLVCQTAFQFGFDGYFDEFYIDISKRRNVYLKQVLQNLRTAYISNDSYLSKIQKKICCLKTNNREKTFNHIIRAHNFDSLLAETFIEDDQELKRHFITVCDLILSQHQSAISNRIVPVDC